MPEYCPCGSNLTYEDCCGALHQGRARATTALALMRSRYAAFARQDMDYLLKTQDPASRDGFDADGTADWNQDVVWKELRILGCKAGGEKDEKGRVEFQAYYEKDGQPGVVHEQSRFVKKNGRWYYLYSKTEQAVESDPEIKARPKAGRNEPCPCGSGLKFKRCCGK